MAYVQPNTDITLYKGIPWHNDYEDTLFFSTKASQIQWFANYPANKKRTYDNYSYVRKSRGKLRISDTMLSSAGYNYMTFTNIPYENKTYYCFVTNVEYINDSTVELTYEIDYMQTYAFDYTIAPGFIEREHVMSDGYNENIYDEDIDTGEFIISKRINLFDSYDNFLIVIASSVNLTDSTFPTVAGGYSDGVYHGERLYGCPVNKVTALNTVLFNLQGAGKGQSVTKMFMFPIGLTDYNTSGLTGDIREINTTSTTPEESVTFFDSSFTFKSFAPEYYYGYVPRNKKLYHSPYANITIETKGGNSIVLKPEGFKSGKSGKFRLENVLSPDYPTRCCPINYNLGFNVDEQYDYPNYDYSLFSNPTPLCSWQYGVYQNWYAQNQNSIKANLIHSGIDLIGGIGLLGAGVFAGSALTGGQVPLPMNVPTVPAPYTGTNTQGLYLGYQSQGGFQQISNSLRSINMQFAQIKDRKIIPNSVEGSVANGSYDVKYISSTHPLFQVQIRTVKAEYAERIDYYFDLFGYKVNRFGVPNRNGRACWNYVKTINALIEPYQPQINVLPMDAQLAIASIYNNGIRFWNQGTDRHGTTISIGDYANLDNTLDT